MSKPDTPMTSSPSQRPAAPRVQWRDPAERGAVAGGARSDEFAPEVARALAALRTTHGHGNASCQPAGNAPAELDALREELHAVLPGVNRRSFMQLTGAAAVFSLAGCYKKHPDVIVPHAEQPEGRTIGNAVYYSSTLRDGGRPLAVMVKTYDGRPIKIEGNPDHPLTRGKADARTQAALLNLYDPDRLQNGPLQRTAQGFAAIAWKDLDAAVGAALRSGKVGLVTGPIDGPARRRLLDELRQALGERLVHGVVDPNAEPRFAGARGALVNRVDRAALLLTIGADFLANTGVAEHVEFGDFRRLKGAGEAADCGQLIAIEPVMSQTGLMADVRVRCAPDRLAWAAWAIAAQVAKALGQALPAGIGESLERLAAGKPLGEALGLRPVEQADAIAFTAGRLLAVKQAGRASLVYGGSQPIAGDANAVHLYAAVQWLNTALGNDGVTVEAAAAESAVAALPASSVLESAARGELATLIIVDVNPLHALAGYPRPQDLLKEVKLVVALADRPHETARLAHLVAPTLHGLESWGDAESRAGVFSLQQPCIQPLWDARAAEESLMAFVVAAGIAPAGFKQAVQACDPKRMPQTVASAKPLWTAAANGVQSWQNYVRATWITALKPRVKSAADERGFWQAALARGVVSVPVAAKAPAPFAAPAGLPGLQPFKTDGSFSLVRTVSRTMGDGTWLNNAWLQELPDPVSKITWDNYLAMSAKDAADKGIREDDVVTLTVGKAALKLPVHIQEGQHPGVLETFTGWGREKDCAGQVANFGIEHGFSVNAWLLGEIDARTPVTIEKTGERYQLANMQGHGRMEGRDIAVDDVLELHRADPGGGKRKHHHELWAAGTDGKPAGRLSLFRSEHDYVGHKWGMSVDLSTCTGCNACVVACNAENNIPVVGRDEVRKGREMHWIRIDRYYASAGDDTDMLDVEAVSQPVMCQQCGNAPCEEVCPAMATMHNDEGVNVMVYNRCIGTRYCSNNCPYKVRRFNWYEYGKYRFGPQSSGEPLSRIARNVLSEGATSSQAELNRHPLELLLNPEVTVRSRGVMEKCNFCLQRTREVREREKATNRRAADGEAKTACAQTCATGAITFGDLNEPGSAVNQAIAAAHAYKLLDAELNTRPAVTYLARIRNRPLAAGERALLEHAHGAPAAHGDAPAPVKETH
jgi:molybdopterin-containing oxidoreductase family iron-sulfur binding subunit